MREFCFLLLLLVVLVTGADVTQAQTRPEAAGWLQLERDQTSYRERVGPLDLREQRRLENLERNERNALRALQQDQRRDLQTERRRAPLSSSRNRNRNLNPNAVPAAPRRDATAERRRAAERQRLQFRMQREQLPYSRRR
jgi:hypothetical protein